MKSRLVASVALSALVLVGATGCTFITPQSTTLVYSASDGVNVHDDGPVDVRNAMIITNEDGTAGNFVAVLVNNGDSAELLSIEVDGLAPLRVNVPAGERISFGGNTDPLPIDGFSAVPGSTVTVYFQSGGESAFPAEIPVLDGTLEYYSDLAP